MLQARRRSLMLGRYLRRALNFAELDCDHASLVRPNFSTTANMPG
jgi:hypothetical protein